ncbi:tRNA guanosine(34) transglycosylase Tgt [Candidatus Woesearchaeota archaeon]|nr:tRNA guanosine(34) transglycosylase Tgt [Candidatus Woesearchaeota archaeon]
MQFLIKTQSKSSGARTGIIKTLHGAIHTPYLIPVATAATVRGLDQKDMESLGAEVLLANTYHLHLKPGEKTIKKLHGLHEFMNWHKPLFTDSGGFQAFSLGYGMEHNINKIGSFFPGSKTTKKEDMQEKKAVIDDNGIRFKAHDSGKLVHLNPEKSIKIQQDLGADIILALDECTSPLSDYEYTRNSMERTHKWALESLKWHKKKAKRTKQALYGIIQGGEYKDLRLKSAKFISSLGFDGIAIGGSLGKSKDDMYKILDWVTPLLPKSKPVHLLGIGSIEDVFGCVEKGIDTFDCVLPTRVARRGSLFISPESKGSPKNKFRINIDNAKFKLDKNPIDKNCNCVACKNYSRAYLSHLFRTKELAYYRLASLHNVNFMLRLMEKIRDSIDNNSFNQLKKKWLKA